MRLDMHVPDRVRLLAIVLASALLLGVGTGPRASAQAGVRTFEIQGAAHVSPLAGQRVEGVPGIVTALRSNGFYLQDSEGDGRPETSDAVFVFTQRNPDVLLGDTVLVSGQVREFRPADDETNLSITEIAEPAVTVVARDQPLRRRSCSGRPGERSRRAWSPRASAATSKRYPGSARRPAPSTSSRAWKACASR